MSTGPARHSGDDTFDLIDDAVAALVQRRRVNLCDDITTIALLASLIGRAERCLPELVHDARLNGHTWTQIAQSLATNPYVAHPRSTRITKHRQQMALRH